MLLPQRQGVCPAASRAESTVWEKAPHVVVARRLEKASAEAVPRRGVQSIASASVLDAVAVLLVPPSFTAAGGGVGTAWQRAGACWPGSCRPSRPPVDRTPPGVGSGTATGDELPPPPPPGVMPGLEAGKPHGHAETGWPNTTGSGMEKEAPGDVEGDGLPPMPPGRGGMLGRQSTRLRPAVTSTRGTPKAGEVDGSGGGAGLSSAVVHDLKPECGIGGHVSSASPRPGASVSTHTARGVVGRGFPPEGAIGVSVSWQRPHARINVLHKTIRDALRAIALKRFILQDRRRTPRTRRRAYSLQSLLRLMQSAVSAVDVYHLLHVARFSRS